MASAGAHLPPWDKKNDQGGLFRRSKYKEILIRDCVRLRDNLRMADIWPHLLQMGVISHNDEERMKCKVNCESVDQVIKFINTCQTWTYHALLRAMALTQQGHLIPHGGLPPEVYRGGIITATSLSDTSRPSSPVTTYSNEPKGSPHQFKKDHFYKKAGSDTKLLISRDLLPALLRHCEVSQEYLLKAPLFGFHDDIMIDLTKIHVETSARCTFDKKSKTIGWKELFCKVFDEERRAPNTLLVDGEAGSGKTTFLEDFALRHCKEFTECEEKGPECPCPGHSWKLILYIPAVGVVGSQMDAIRDNLFCDDKDKDQVINMIKDDGEGVLVMNDGLDELRKEAEKNSLRQYTISHQRGGRPKVLNSARHGLSNIEERFFDHKVSLEGFTIDEGLLYVKDYFKQCPENMTELMVLFKHIKEQKTKLEWLLTNPLRAHVFTHLSTNGQLRLDDIKHLTQAKLLKVLESFVVKREEKSGRADAAEAHSAQFYRACLDCLLTDERTIMEQKIPHMSPYKALLDKYKTIDLYAKEESYFKFGHEALFEFFSVQGLCEYLKSHPSHKKALLLHVCVDPNMRNVIQLLFGFISEYEPGLHNDLIFILQACLILQAQSDSEKIAHIRSQVQQADEVKLMRLLDLPGLIEKTSAADILNASTNIERVMSDISEQIEAAFNENAENLRAAGWFVHAGYKKPEYRYDSMLLTMHSTALLDFIAGCLRECSSGLQEMIFSRTIHKLIPTKLEYRTMDHYVYPVSGVRWGVVRVAPGETSIHSWCPHDMVSTLRQLYTQHTLPTDVHTQHTLPIDVHMVDIHLDDPASLWGVPPPELLSCNHWVSALHEVYKHRVDDLTINTDHISGTTPADGLLQALQCVTIPTHCLTYRIDVWYGQVSEEVLVSLCEWVHTVRRTVQLHDITVLLTTQCDEDYVTQLHQRVHHVMDNVATPTYKTPTGRTVSYTEPSSDESSDGIGGITSDEDSEGSS